MTLTESARSKMRSKSRLCSDEEVELICEVLAFRITVDAAGVAMGAGLRNGSAKFHARLMAAIRSGQLMIQRNESGVTV